MLTELGVLDGVTEHVTDGVCDGVYDGVWLFGKDSFKECPLTKGFIFQCCLYFWGLSEFEDNSKRVTFALSYLQDVAQEWFEPGISSITDDYPEWLDSWDLFVEELQNNFGPFDESTDVEHELTNLQMKDSQCISEYLICFNSLAVCCPWGEATLRYREGRGSTHKGRVPQPPRSLALSGLGTQQPPRMCSLLIPMGANRVFTIFGSSEAAHTTLTHACPNSELNPQPNSHLRDS